MKPPPFTYLRAESLDGALSALAEGGGDAKLLAGGQSLVPALNFRLVRPAQLVDIDRLRELDYLVAADDGLRIGALRRHAALERDAGFGASWAALGEAVAEVGHLPIRLRGTFGGSVAHADPAAELPVVALAFGAQIVLRSSRGERRLPAEAFFVAPYITAIAPDEAVVEVFLPAPPPGAVSAFEEFAERAGDYALASVCALLALEDGTVASARLALGSVGPTPVRAHRAEAVLTGGGEDAIDEAARTAARECDPSSDSHASAEYRRELVAALTRRALRRAWRAAG